MRASSSTGFFEKVDCPALHSSDTLGNVAVSGNENNRKLCPARYQFSLQLQAIDFRHSQIQKQATGTSRFVGSQEIASGRKRLDRQTLGFEKPAHGSACPGIIVDNEDRCISTHYSLSTWLIGRLNPKIVPWDSPGVIQISPPCGGYDGTADCQAHAKPAFLCCDKSIKKLAHHLIGYAWSPNLHLDFHSVGIAHSTIDFHSPPVRGHVADSVDRVRDQVHDHLLQFDRIGGDRCRGCRRSELQRDALVSCKRQQEFPSLVQGGRRDLPACVVAYVRGRTDRKCATIPAARSTSFDTCSIASITCCQSDEASWAGRRR